jgi:thioredoxin-related protein
MPAMCCMASCCGTGPCAVWLKRLDSVQLDMRAATPVVTPSGERTRARDWAAALGLFHAPTLIFFDEQGREILRLDSLARFYRLGQVLSYITSGAYRYQRYPQWRAQGSAE